MPPKLPLLLLLVALVGGGLYWGLGQTDDPEDAPEVSIRTEDEEGLTGARRVGDSGATRDEGVTRTEAATDDEPADTDTDDESRVDLELTTRVRGQVVDIVTGETIADARVTITRSARDQGIRSFERDLRLRDRRPKSATTDAEGRFDIGVQSDWVGGDLITALVRSDGYQVLTGDPIQLRLDQINDIGLLRATPAPMLSLQVIDSYNQPIAGAKVRAFDSTGPRVEFLQPPSSDEGDEPRVAVSVAMTSFDDDTGPNEFGGNMIPFALGNFDGEVRLTEYTTDEEGRVRIPCQPGDLGLRLTHETHATTEAQLIMPEQGGLSEVVTMADAPHLVVIVTDDQGEPVVGRRVEARTEILGTETAETDDRGIARFDHLPIGFVSVRLARKPRAGVFFVQGARGRSSEPEPEMISTELFPGQDTEVRLTAAPRAIANVLVTLDGEPLVGARVTSKKVEDDSVESPSFIDFDGLFAGGRGARTDDDGRITMGDLELGTTQFSIRHPDLALSAQTKAELIAGEQDLRFDFTTSRIVGRVLDPEGQPVSEATVRLVSQNSPGGAIGNFVIALDATGGGDQDVTSELTIGPNDSVKTDVDGRFEFRLVPSPDPLTVRVRDETGEGEFPQQVQPREGERVDVGTLTLSSVGRAEITVNSESEIIVVVAQRLDASGEPVGDQRIQPARDGEVTFESLMPGLWRFRLGFGSNAVSVERQVFSGRTTTLTLGE